MRTVHRAFATWERFRERALETERTTRFKVYDSNTAWVTADVQRSDLSVLLLRDLFVQIERRDGTGCN